MGLNVWGIVPGANGLEELNLLCRFFFYFVIISFYLISSSPYTIPEAGRAHRTVYRLLSVGLVWLGSEHLSASFVLGSSHGLRGHRQ